MSFRKPVLVLLSLILVNIALSETKVWGQSFLNLPGSANSQNGAAKDPLHNPISGPSVYVDADEYTSKANQSSDLKGHVKIIRGDEQLTCDRAHVDQVTNDVVADGNVLLMSPREYIKAEHLTYNFKTQTGIVYNGFVQMGQETIEGEQIMKTSESEYEAVNASYTSCVNCPPSWKVSGSHISATPGAYAYIKSPVFRIYNFPVLWLPYMIIPIKSERQSGFLPPMFGQGSTNGFTIGESYFWAIDKSRDATLTETHYAARGWKTGVEYRFISSKDSQGGFLGNALSDHVYGSDLHYIAPDPRYNNYNGLPYLRTPQDSTDRYAIHYAHHFQLPDNYIHNVNINLVRDVNYPQEFPQEMPGAGDPALENRINFAKNTENMHSSIDMDIYNNLLKSDPIGTNSDAVHRAPEIDYSIMPFRPIEDFPMLASLNANYVNFSRAGVGYDKANPNAGFQQYPTTAPAGEGVNGVFPADRYRTGERFMISPDLSFPLTFGNDVFELVPEATYTESYYEFGYSPQPTARRRQFRGTVQAKTRLSGIFGDLDDPKATKYKHEFEPNITYTWVPYLNQDRHPFFLGPLAQNNTFGGTYLPHYTINQPVTEFDNLQFDYRDRLTDLNLITLGMTNVLVRKKTKPGESKAIYNELIRHTLTQSYDFYTALAPDTSVVKQPWSEVHSLLEMHWDFLDVYSDVSYYEYQNAASNSTTVGVHDSKNNAIAIGYAQSYGIPVDFKTGLVTNQIDISTQSEFASLKIYYTSDIIDMSGQANFDLLAKAFSSFSVTAIAKPPGKCWGLGVTIEQNLQGATSINANLPIYFGNGSNNNLPRPPGV